MGGSWNWRKSTHSGNVNADCLEVAWTGQRILIRDSKHPLGPALSFPPDAWQELIATLRVTALKAA